RTERVGGAIITLWISSSRRSFGKFLKGTSRSSKSCQERTLRGRRWKKHARTFRKQSPWCWKRTESWLSKRQAKVPSSASRARSVREASRAGPPPGTAWLSAAQGGWKPLDLRQRYWKNIDSSTAQRNQQ